MRVKVGGSKMAVHTAILSLQSSEAFNDKKSSGSSSEICSIDDPLLKHLQKVIERR